MRTACLLLASVLLTGSLSWAEQEEQACKFSVRGEPSKPTVTGPADVVSRIRMLDQPESPIEIASLDLEGTVLSFAHGRLYEQFCTKLKVRNRSDRVIQKAMIMIHGVFTPPGSGGFVGTELFIKELTPGKETELVSCPERGTSGSASNDNFSLLVTVESVDFPGCRYFPSIRIPYRDLAARAERGSE